MTLPLSGLLVVALEQAVAAPMCSCRLADAGARVIKLERPEGDFARFYDEFDLLVTPTMTIEPPKVGLLEAVHAEAGPTTEIVAMAAFTAVFNITGQPAISLPLHMAPSGLPVGVQIVAGPWREAQLIRVSAQLESADPWAERVPVDSSG